jgi:hypothetical protein
MIAEPADLEKITAPPVQEVAPSPEEAAEETQAAAELSSKGAIPEVAATTVAAAAATASEQAFGDKPKAEAPQLDAGMHRPEDYRAICEASGTPEKWDPKYAHGHTSASQWMQPYEGRHDMTFTLHKGQSASQAVKDFLVGPTIADFRVIGVAIEMDTLRGHIGDARFDQLFGSSDRQTDAAIDTAQRLKIASSMYSIPFAEQMMTLAADNAEAARRAQQPEAPIVEARVEEKPQVAEVVQPAPETIAEELGLRPEQQLA